MKYFEKVKINNWEINLLNRENENENNLEWLINTYETLVLNIINLKLKITFNHNE